MIIRRKKVAGFTLVELMLSMTFIAFMLMFVISAVMQATRQYSKGQAISQINQTSQQLLDNISRSVRYESPVYITFDGGKAGRLCVGNTSYIWNDDGADAGSRNYFVDDGGNQLPDTLKLVSIADTGGSYCQDTRKGIPQSQSRDLVGGDITPLVFNVSQTGRLWTISVVLSTIGSDGDNKAYLKSGSTTDYECDPNNQFCAFGSFVTSVYARGQ